MISNLKVKKTYTGNGSTRSWPVPFSYGDADQIKVKTTVSGVETLVPSTNYTVDTASNAIIYPKVESTESLLDSSMDITIYRITSLTQSADLTNQGGAWPETIEGCFDKVTEIVQEQAEAIDRCVKVSISSDTNPDELLAELKVASAVAVSSAAAATASETNAKTSETAAALSETNSKTSENNAKDSETNAKTSETAAALSETNSKTSETAAALSETNSKTSEDNAKDSETNAAASASMSSEATGVVNCILKGRKITSVSGFNASISAGTIVANELRKAILTNTITLPARATALVYDNVDGTTSYTKATIPTAYIDNNTVGFYDFSNWDGSSVIPNSAVGMSSIAVANNLTPSGTVAKVDGVAGYAAKGDGINGMFTASNVTNIPSGLSPTIEVSGEFLFNAYPSSSSYLFCAGTDGYGFGLYVRSDKLLYAVYGGTGTSSGFTINLDERYNFSYSITGNKVYLSINGTPIFSVVVTIQINAGAFKVFNYVNGSYYANATIDYIEIRNALRPASTLGAISNKLLLSCFYDKNSAVAPIIPSAFASLYHEYLMGESSGTTVADSNTTNPLNGTAVGTTITTSEIGLVNARKLTGVAGSYISYASFACASAFSLQCVINTLSWSTPQALWSNAVSTSSGTFIYINSSGYITIWVGGVNYTLSTRVVPTNTPVFITVSINGTKATTYVNDTVGSVTTIPNLNTSSNIAYFGHDSYNNVSFNGTVDYIKFGNFELTQAEILQDYTALMATGRRSIIDDVLPTGAVSLGFARTNSSEIIEYNDADYWTGRREKAVGGNRRAFLGWYSFSGNATINIDNPFSTRKVECEIHWAQDAKGTNESPVIPAPYQDAGYYYGAYLRGVTTNKIQLIAGANGVAIFNGSLVGSGYLGVYAECLEDYEGADSK